MYGCLRQVGCLIEVTANKHEWEAQYNTVQTYKYIKYCEII